MASEASIQSTLTINVRDSNGRVKSHRKNFGFSADVSTFKGPTPGIVSATTTGVEISLAELTNPGLCTMQNLSDTYRALVGIKDTSSGLFEPLLEFLPGEGFTFRLARMLGSELTGGSGTGTAGSGGVLWVKGVDGTVLFDTQAFEL